MKKIVLLLAAAVLSFFGCAAGGEEAAYVSISAEEAKVLMDGESGHLILDVRTQEEYDGGHIAGAVLIPHEEIAERAEEEIADKERLILVYCRSGRRSKLAAQKLAELGYTNVREFGGINDWPYGVEAP